MVVIDNYQELANAIINQAAQDYRVALVNQHKGDVKTRLKATREIRELRRFFYGKLFEQYTKLNGPNIMAQIRDEVIKYDYDLDALEKSHKE